ncbi:SoxR reducing system RseC family protein [Arsukibacterium sp.]|uniref:SoxR reducing system RseC family protein n=1 Tax=Arsukibacterium sp. TaxID=1977258 RepID=UPI002FDA70CF
MVEQIATVLATDTDGVWLTTSPVSSCNACQVSTDCGTGIVTKTFTPRTQRFFVATTLPLLPGEQVTIGMAEQGLVLAAARVYLLPLLLMLVSVLLLHWWLAPAEAVLLLAAAASLGAGFMLARWYDQRQATLSQQLTIVAVLPQLGLKNT